MTSRLRTVLFVLMVVIVSPTMIAGLSGLPAFGSYPGPYGDIVNRLVIPARHITNAVTGVNFDFRGLDTLGEELILFASTTGVAMLLRGSRGQATSARPIRILHRRRHGRSEAVTMMARIMAPVTFVFAVYVVLHAQLTPGGGFQGGVLLFAALFLVYLGNSYGAWRRFTPDLAVELAEAFGIAVYLVGGLVPLALGGAYLENLLPLGAKGSILSGGLIGVLNIGVAFAVAAGFCSLGVEFLEETREFDEGHER